MSVSLTLALYLIVWWIVLFTLLPFKMGAVPAPPGGDPYAEAAGAPSSPKLRTKFVLTTIIAALIVGALYAAFAFGVIEFGPPPAAGAQ